VEDRCNKKRGLLLIDFFLVMSVRKNLTRTRKYDTLLNMGWTDGNSRLVRISPEIPLELHTRLKAIAFASKKSIGDIALEAIITYTHMVRRQQRVILEPKILSNDQMRQISVRRLPNDTYTTLRILAIRENTSMKLLIHDALRAYVDPIWDELKNQIKKGLEDAALLHKTGS